MGGKGLWRAGKVAAGFLLAVSVAAPVAAFAGPPVSVVLDGQTLTFDVPPQWEGNRVLVPFRKILESLGATVWWDGNARSAYAKKGNDILRIPIGQPVIYKDDQPIPMDVVSEIVAGRTMVPVRFVSQALGETVGWDGNTNTVSITTPSASNAQGGPQPAAPSLPPVTVKTEDPNVTAQQIQHVEDLLAGDQILSRVGQDLQMNVTAPITVYLAGSPSAYEQLLVHHGFSQSDAAQIAQVSAGLADGNDVYIPLYVNADDPDLVNVLFHELTHVYMNQNGLGASLPSWINEGIAWQEGLEGQAMAEPPVLFNGYLGQIHDAILQAAANHNLVPLYTSSYDTIHSNASYNVEWQDYMAEQKLVSDFGLAKRTDYLNRLRNGDNDAFVHTFGETESSFESAFDAYLNALATRPDQGATIRFAADSPFQGQVAVMPKGTSTWYSFRPVAGQTYTIHISPSGQVDGMPGMTSHTTTDPADASTVYIAVIPDTPQMIGGKEATQGGFAIGYGFSEYYYLDSWIFFADQTNQFPVADDVLGVRLLSVNPGIQ